MMNKKELRTEEIYQANGGAKNGLWSSEQDYQHFCHSCNKLVNGKLETILHVTDPVIQVQTVWTCPNCGPQFGFGSKATPGK